MNVTDGMGRNAFRYAYNLNGWSTNRWTPEKGNTAYTYDGVGNLKSILYPQSSILYAYDALNRLTNMVDALATHNFSWTPGSRLAGESDAWTTNAWNYSQGLRTAMTIAQPGGSWAQSYGYDSSWRMTNTVSPAGNFNYGYAFQPASPLVTSITLPNGANIVNNYDSLARLTATALNNYWGHTLDGYTYAPDPLGLRTNIVRNFGLTTNSVSVGYDNIGQITSWLAAETGGTLRQNEQLGFAYDPAHNLHTRTNGGLWQTFNTDAANQLNSVSRAGTFTLAGATPSPAKAVAVNGQPAQTYGDFTFAAANLGLNDGNNTFTIIATNLYGAATTNVLTSNLPQTVTLKYDNNGNLTNDGVRSLAYDWENRLTNVTVAGQWRSDFVYDGLKRRRLQRDYVWQGGAWVTTNEVHYVCDGCLPVQERDAGDRVLVTYTRGLDASGSLQSAGGIGGLLARTDPNGSLFYHADGNENITALMDASENVAARYLYNPSGGLIGQWGPLAAANAMRFSSMPYGTPAGLSFFAFRAYEPHLQRWLNQDPIQERGGINLSRAMDNDPVNKNDPYGLDNIYNMSAGNNAVPNITLSGTVGGGQVNTQFNGGGWGDPIFMLTALTGPPAWLAGGSTMAGGRWGLAAKGALLALKAGGHKEPCPANSPKPPGWTPDWQWGPPTGDADGDWRWFDPDGGEWRRHEADRWHPDSHWDYKPWDAWNSPWQNIDDNGNAMN